MRFLNVAFSAAVLTVSGRVVASHGLRVSSRHYSASIIRQTSLSTISGVSTSPSGNLGTLDYRLHYQAANGEKLSPWHDVSLRNGLNVNFLTEVSLPVFPFHPFPLLADSKIRSDENGDLNQREVQSDFARLKEPEATMLCRTHLLELWMSSPDLGGSQ